MEGAWQNVSFRCEDGSSCQIPLCALGGRIADPAGNKYALGLRPRPHTLAPPSGSATAGSTAVVLQQGMHAVLQANRN